MGSTSDQNRVRERLLREDLFTVVMEQFPTDTVDYADIVLPATMQIEHADLHAGYGHMYLMWNEPAVEPPGECLSTTETFRRLARHMGLDRAVPVRLRPGAGRAAAHLGAPVAGGHHARPAAQGGLGPAQRPAAVRAVHRRLPDGLGQAGVRPGAGLRPVAHGLGRAGPYPLALITPASHTFLNTTFGNNPELLRRSKGPRVLVNPADAASGG